MCDIGYDIVDELAGPKEKSSSPKKHMKLTMPNGSVLVIAPLDA
jgi:hypothetical protein